METKANYVAVGGFVLLGALALIAALIWTANAQYRTEYAYYTASFTGSVTGLGAGTTVRYNGIEVGTVSDLSFDEQDPRKVNTLLQVDPDLRLRADSVASVESEGLAGATYVGIIGGTPTAPILVAREDQRYPEIRAEPSTLQQVRDITPQILDRIDQVAMRAGDLLNDDNREAVAITLQHLMVATERLNATIQSTDEATQGIREAARGIDNAARSVASLSESVDGVVAESRGQVQESAAQLNQLLSETRLLVASLTRLADDLEREPTRLIFGDRTEGYTPP